MSVGPATWISVFLAAYVAVGVVYAVRSLVKGIDPDDPDVVGSSRGFRLAVAPALVALWPSHLRRGLGARTGVTPHDRPAARSGASPRRIQFWAILALVVASFSILAVAWSTRPDATATQRAHPSSEMLR